MKNDTNILAHFSGANPPLASLGGLLNEESLAILSKLVREQNKNTDTSNAIDINKLPNLYSKKDRDDRIRRINETEMVLEMLPELKLGININVASIISPTDMDGCDLNFGSTEDNLPSSVRASLVGEIRGFFTNRYKLNDSLSKIIEESLFTIGSYPLLVLPESSIDDIINNSYGTESYRTAVDSIKIGSIRKPTWLVNPSSKAGFESAIGYKPEIEGNLGNDGVFDLGVSVIDNLEVLKIPSILERQRKAKAQAVYGAEGFKVDNSSAKWLKETFFKKNRPKEQPVVIVNHQDDIIRETVGNPIIYHVPHEAVSVITAAGDPKKAVGFLLFLDDNGHFISRKEHTILYDKLYTDNSANSTSMSSHFIHEAARNMPGETPTYNDIINNKDNLKVYSSIVEENILARLRNVINGGEADLGNTDDIYRVMLARALAGKRTQVLYVPPELMTYFSYNYNPDGTGKSLLEKSKVINSMRVVLKMARMYASVQNSIGRTNVDVKLDPMDQTPQKTIEMVADAVVAARRNSAMPISINPSDVMDWIPKAGISFSISGNQKLPDIEINIDESQSNKAMPDETLEDNLMEQSLMNIGSNPEIINAAKELEYAAEVHMASAMFNRRVVAWQRETEPQLTDHVIKVTKSSGYLMKQLRDIVKSNIKLILMKQFSGMSSSERAEVINKLKANRKSLSEYIDVLVDIYVKDFVEGIYVELPRPDFATSKSKLDAFNQYKDLVEEAVQHYISQDILNDKAIGELANYDIDYIQRAVVSDLLRTYIDENGILPKLTGLVTKNDTGEYEYSMAESLIPHIRAISSGVTRFIRDVKEVKDAANTVANKLLSDEDMGGSSDYSSDTDTGTTDDTSTEDDTLDSLDDDLDSLLGGDEGEAEPEAEEPAEDEEPTEEETTEE